MARGYTMWLLLLLFLNYHFRDCWATLGVDCSSDANLCDVTNSQCDTGATNRCVCDDEYTQINDECLKGLGDTCTDDADCMAVDNSNCVTNGGGSTCACGNAFNPVDGACTPKGLGDTCTADADCMAVDNSNCVTNGGGSTCACGNAFNPADGACTPKVLGDTCTVNGDCMAVDNSMCVTNGDGSSTCACDDAFNQVDGACTAKAVNETQCTAEGGGCEHIDNALCDAESGYCTCSSGFVMNVSTCENAAASLEAGAVILVLSVFATIQIMF